MKDVLCSVVAIIGLSSLVGCGVQQAREAEGAAKMAQAEAERTVREANRSLEQDGIAKESTQRAVKAEKEAATLRKQLQEVRKLVDRWCQKRNDARTGLRSSWRLGL
jgi:predicted small lipoprotein YifL